MKLRAQLVLALLLLAVVPLAGMTIYSYVTSQRVLRRAVEAEARALAEGMGARMEATGNELARRIDSIRRRSRREWSDEYAKARQDALDVTQREQSRVILQAVLAHTSRERGEIPFAIDAEGQLHAADPSDLPRLRTLSLDGIRHESGVTLPESVTGQWVVVTRKAHPSDLTLGIARPVGESLTEIRRNALANLGYGLALVGLALLGILPLSGRMTRNLDRLTQGAERLARGDLETRVPVRSRDEFGHLAETFNRMARDLREHQEGLLQQERLRKELEMGRRIQRELLPRASLPLSFCEVKGVSIPAREVGGDFFNYFVLPGGEVAILVGDVSGKGVAAALLMANLQATLLARLPLERNLASLAGRLDREIDGLTPAPSYLTLFMAVLDGETGELRHVNAGHTPQYVLRASGGIEILESVGRPLGLLPGGGYQERRLTLTEGDVLFLFTDGLVEAENAEGEPFGGRLEALLGQERAGDVDRILTSVEQAVHAHRGGADAADDATMVVLRLARASPMRALRDE